MGIQGFLDLVGNTPVVHLKSHETERHGHVKLFAKLECYNPTGSIKDRPAAYIIRKLLATNQLNHDSVVVESSSGNFGVALSAVSRAAGLRFICVVDPLILRSNEYLLGQFGAEIVKVTKPDESGGYLKARLAKIAELTRTIPNCYWINQYGNPLNAESHCVGTGAEIHEAFKDIGLDYVFVAVSSGGTITGVSQALKRQSPSTKVIAVDTSGSVIFGGPPRKRFIPGMGSSIVPEILKQAHIDDVFDVQEENMVAGCMQLLRDHGLFLGGSSGAVFFAAHEYFRYSGAGDRARDRDALNVLMLFADRGERYAQTIYNPEWIERTFPHPNYQGTGDALSERP